MRCWSVIGVHGMTPGVFVAYIRAAAAIRSGSHPVIAATRSRGNSSTRRRNASKPEVQRATKSRSWRPSSRITLIQPKHIAASVPARRGSQRSASSAFSERRGSSTMSFAPFFCAARIAL